MKNIGKGKKKFISISFDSAKTLITVIIFVFTAVSAGATNYYVSLSGDNSYTGLSAEQAWRTITFSATKAKAGDTVYIKGGNYGHEHVVVSNSGTSGSQIVFEGYEGTPVLDAGDYDGRAIYIYGKSYITLRNIRVAKYRYGIWIDGSSNHAILDGCVADSCCNTNYTSYGYDGYGLLVQSSNYCELRNCSTTDNGGDNIFLSKANFCTLYNCKVYSKQTVSNQFITDYYVVLAWSSNNTIRNCYAEDINGSYKGNHGFIIKDGGTGTQHSTGNLFVNCTANKFEECFVCAHEAYENKFDSCHADNTGKHSTFNFCFQNRDGAYSNTFSNCTAVGLIGIASIYSGTETSCTDNQKNTLFENCIFKGVYSTTIGAFLRNATNTTFKNCTYVDIPRLFRFSKSGSGSDSNSGTILRNCILSNVAETYDNSSLSSPWASSGTETGYNDLSDVTTFYSDFWNGISPLSGTGNISADPLFADAANSDFHLKSQYGRWNGKSWVNDDVTSPCIDAGAPEDAYINEPSFNGNRINMGAYGNTAEASKSSETNSLKTIENEWLSYRIENQKLILQLSASDLTSGPVYVTLTTMDGKIVRQIFKQSDSVEIDISGYRKGIMICTVTTSDGTKSIKFLNN
jgi:hypothetical protein